MWKLAVGHVHRRVSSSTAGAVALMSHSNSGWHRPTTMNQRMAEVGGNSRGPRRTREIFRDNSAV